MSKREKIEFFGCLSCIIFGIVVALYSGILSVPK